MPNLSWINTKDKLPLSDVFVLGYNPNYVFKFSILKYRLTPYDSNLEGRWYSVSGDYITEPTHWAIIKEPSSRPKSKKVVIFKLSMPRRASWNGEWSGEGKNYTITRQLPLSKAEILDGNSFGYHFGDGWTADVSCRIKQPGERLKKSYGFCGYDWMVSSIITFGYIKPT